MDTLYRDNNVFIRRRITIWDPATRKNIPYTSGTAPNGFFGAAADTIFSAKFTNCGGVMVHVGDGWWEVQVLGIDLNTNLPVNGTIVYERVVIDNNQLDEAVAVRVANDRQPTSV